MGSSHEVQRTTKATVHTATKPKTEGMNAVIDYSPRRLYIETHYSVSCAKFSGLERRVARAQMGGVRLSRNSD